MVAYTFYFPHTSDNDSTQAISIILKEPPSYDKDNETGNESFQLEAKQISRDFVIKYWVINDRSKQLISDLKIDEKVVLVVEKRELNGRYVRRSSEPIDVLGIKKLGGDWIFSLNDYNEAKASRWKEYLFYGLFFMILLLPWLLFELRRIVRNDPKIVTKIESSQVLD